MGRVTRRKYAADLYPHADECEVRDRLDDMKAAVLAAVEAVTWDE